jgi:hypothetical protein
LDPYSWKLISIPAMNIKKTQKGGNFLTILHTQKIKKPIFLRFHSTIRQKHVTSQKSHSQEKP